MLNKKTHALDPVRLTAKYTSITVHHWGKNRLQDKHDAVCSKKKKKEKDSPKNLPPN